MTNLYFGAGAACALHGRANDFPERMSKFMKRSFLGRSGAVLPTGPNIKWFIARKMLIKSNMG